MKRRNEKRDAAIVAEYRDGWPTSMIAAAYGISDRRVYQITSAAGAYRSPRYPANPKIDVRTSVRETAVANRGKASASQIAAAIGVTRNSIIGHWNRAGLSVATQ